SKRDWSSDVCSSDLDRHGGSHAANNLRSLPLRHRIERGDRAALRHPGRTDEGGDLLPRRIFFWAGGLDAVVPPHTGRSYGGDRRSEERSVGKEWRAE